MTSLWPGHVASYSYILLENHALAHLRRDAQELECLELVGAGHDLRDDGLLPIFETRKYRIAKTMAIGLRIGRTLQ